MIKKHFGIFLPILILTSGMFIYLIFQYKPLFPNNYEYQKAEQNKTFHVPILRDDPTFGNQKANNTIILFTDYNCLNCQKEITYFQNLLKKYPDQIKFVWKNVLLNDFDKNKTLAHYYAYCASEQKKFWAFQIYAFENQKNFSPSLLNSIINKLDINTKKFEKCLKKEEVQEYIQRNQFSAQGLSIKIFPTIFLNNKQIYSTEELTKELNNLFDEK